MCATWHLALLPSSIAEQRTLRGGTPIAAVGPTAQWATSAGLLRSGASWNAAGRRVTSSAVRQALPACRCRSSGARDATWANCVSSAASRGTSRRTAKRRKVAGASGIWGWAALSVVTLRHNYCAREDKKLLKRERKERKRRETVYEFGLT